MCQNTKSRDVQPVQCGSNKGVSQNRVAISESSRGVERYAVARSNTTDDYNAHTRGYAVAPPRATFLNRYAILLHSDGLFERHCTARASGKSYC